MIKYQGKKLIAIRSLSRCKVTSKLVKMANSGESIVADPKGAFFHFKKGQGPNYALYAVYRWDGNFPRFITYLQKFVNSTGKTTGYGTTMS